MPFFNVYQIVIFIGLVNGFILLMTLSGLPEEFKLPSRILGLFIVGYTCYIGNWTVFASISYKVGIPMFWVPSLYFLPALTYLFARSITGNEIDLRGKDGLFLLPGLIDTLVQLGRWCYLIFSKQGYVFPLDDRPVFFFYEGTGILFSAFCLTLIFINLRGIDLKKNEAYTFYRFAFIYLTFVLIRWFGLYLLDLFQPSLLSFELQFTFWFMDFCAFFFLGYRKLMAPGKYGLKISESAIKDTYSSELFHHKLEDGKPYLNPDFNRNDLAGILALSEEKVSTILNQELGVSFYELVNKYRVREAKSLLDKGVSKSLTMEAIAMQSGFKSKTTFYKFFKNEFGMRPSDYIKRPG